MTLKLGKPKYEQSKKNYFAFKKDQNTFILRILPPMGDLADSGKWSVYHRVEFGYRGTDGRLKPFLSPRKIDFKTKMVEVESEAHKRREMIKAQKEQAEKSGDTATLQKCKELLQTYNQDAKHYMNVVDLQGNVGLFKIGHKGYLALQNAIEQLRATGVDPIGVENGRFFVFNRSGRGVDTLYTVTEYKQKQIVNGIEGDFPYPHSIDESLMAKLETDSFELDKVYPSVTPEQEYRIVHEGPAAVDEVFGSTQKNEASNPASTQATTLETQTTQAVATEASTPAPEQPTTEVGSSVVNTQTGEVVSETLTTEQSTQTTTPAAQASTTTEQSLNTDVSQMSDDDFFKKSQAGNF